MATETKIQWATHTFNPWIGCTKVSPECAHCYAESDMDKRRGRVRWGPQGTRSLTKTWGDPVKWNKAAAPPDGPACPDCGASNCQRASSSTYECESIFEGDGAYLDRVDRPRVFCASLADVFEDWDGPIVDHRGQRMYWSHSRQPHESKWHWVSEEECAGGESPVTMNDLRARLFALIDATPNLDWLLLTKRPENVRRMWPGAKRDNVWLGTSAGTQATANRAIPELLKCRDLCAKLFVSAEPLLELVDFTSVFSCPECQGGIEWVIFGGESGPGSRHCNIDWIRDGLRQCRAAGVRAFVKQLGEHIQWGDKRTKAGMKTHPLTGKGGDPSEWPEDLRVRELPTWN